MANVGSYAGNAPKGASAKQQRQEVKKIAAEYQSDLRSYKSFTEDGLREYGGGLAEFARSVASQRRRLAKLRAGQLSGIAPPSTLFRSANSGGVLAAAATGRATAMVAAGGVAAVHGALLAAKLTVDLAIAWPVGVMAGTMGGLIAGCTIGAELPVSVLKPVTAIACGLAGAALLGVQTAVAPVASIPDEILIIPERVAARGMLAQKVFRSIDRFAVARAHVKHKKMSTRDIAQETDDMLKKAANMIETKRRTPPKIIESRYIFLRPPAD